VEQITRLYFESPVDLEPIEGEELLRRVQGGEVTLLDVRPADEYRSGHIPGAVSVPPEDLERRLAELPHDRPVIAYCRGPYCVFATEAVELLRRQGHPASRMESGIAEWRLAGHPVASTET
jgi:rhodanese-related sulfurtransferase